MFCVLLSQITSRCTNLFKDFPFSLALFLLKIKRRIDFESRKLRRQNLTPYWLLSTNGLIQIIIRLVGLANRKPCMCYYTCDHMVAINKRINTNNKEASWASQ